jgi:hypothetical protein
LEDAEDDLRQLKLKIWGQKADNSEERASIIEEVKVLRGP